MKFYLGLLGTIAFLALAAAILVNVAGGLVFLLRRDANKRADWFFAALLLAYAATCAHHVLILQDVYRDVPGLLFLPIYLTLSLGVLLFFSVKIRLFPGYQFVPSDGKHLILPVGQFLYFLTIFLLTSVETRQDLGRKFYSPFYGGLEMAIYIATFYAYLFAAYRFIRFKITKLQRANDEPAQHEPLKLRRLLRVMVVLFWVNSAYIVTDFVMYELLRLNMHDFRGFTRFGELSFAAMAGWAGWCGWKILLKRPYRSTSGLVLNLLKMALAKSRQA